MSSQLLTFLKYMFLAVLYLFFLRVLRAVWAELREPKPAPITEAGAPAGEAPPPMSRRQARRAAKGRDTAASQLVLVAPAERGGQTFDLGEELTVGRATGCGIALPDDTFVSQIHARVFRRDGDVWVEDLGSTNGTYLNQKRVAAAVPLRKGDRLQVGQTTLELAP
jgi:pSer/pThr/pTyr-binding forkhead associated (FHA) protein